MEKFVDVQNIIASRNKKLLKWLPRFIIRWIEKIIHQDQVNAIITRHNDDAHTFCNAIIKSFNLKLNIEGLENIPGSSHSPIFASNHPLGGLDAIIIIHLFQQARPDIKFIVNDLLMHVEALRERFIGINKIGKNMKVSLQKVEEQFASDTATFIFPAGLVSRKIKGKIVDLEWKKTIITKAKKYGKLIVPVYIGGQLTNRFYRLANVRKLLGIKLNIEMFFLVDELFRQKNMKIDVVVGESITVETFTKKKSDEEWAQWIKEKVYQLKKEQ